MNTVIENLKIRLQNAINQIEHLEYMLTQLEPNHKNKLISSNDVIAALKESLNDLEPDTIEEDELNRFSMDREQINGQTEFEIQETLLNGLGADRQREQWENHR